jgi:hypothetical protein
MVATAASRPRAAAMRASPPSEALANRQRSAASTTPGEASCSIGTMTGDPLAATMARVCFQRPPSSARVSSSTPAASCRPAAAAGHPPAAQ